MKFTCHQVIFHNRHPSNIHELLGYLDIMTWIVRKYFIMNQLILRVMEQEKHNLNYFHKDTNAFKINRCDRDLCYKFDQHYCSCSMLHITAIPLYTSLSSKNWLDLSKEVLYDLVAWRTSKLPAFKVECLPWTHVLTQFT